MKLFNPQNPPAWAIRAFASEMPQHRVQITKGYWIDKFEVTNWIAAAFVENGGYDQQELWSEEGRAWLSKQDKSKLPDNCVGLIQNLPVCVTWYRRRAYAHLAAADNCPPKLNGEYADPGPKSLIYPWGNQFDPAKANLLDSTAPHVCWDLPGGVSWVGAQDMAGNAMEWVQDWLDVNYYNRKATLLIPVDHQVGG